MVDSRPPDEEPAWGGRHPWIHFLWASPLSVMGGLLFFFIAAVNVCGVSGCTGGGFGESRGNPGATAALLAVGALTWTAPVALIPWTASRRVRLAVMLPAALLLGGLVWWGYVR